MSLSQMFDFEAFNDFIAYLKIQEWYEAEIYIKNSYDK